MYITNYGCIYGFIGYAAVPYIDEGQLTPFHVENGKITVKIGAPVYIVDGLHVDIICDVYGKPPITIKWLRNGMLDPSRGNVSTIKVTDASDGDDFICHAENSIGSTNKTTHIRFTNKKFCIIN